VDVSTFQPHHWALNRRPRFGELVVLTTDLSDAMAEQNLRPNVVARAKKHVCKAGNTFAKTEYFIMVENPPEGVQRMLTETQILALVPFGRTTLWRKEKDGSFPPSTYISKNRHAWFEAEVVDWQNGVRGCGRSQKMQPKKDKAKRPKSDLKPKNDPNPTKP